MNRRTVLLGGATLGGLAGCAIGRSPPIVPAQVIADVGLIAASTNAVLAGAAQVPSISPATVAVVGAAVAQIKVAAVLITSSVSMAAAQPTVATIEVALNVIVAALAGLPLPPQVQLVMQAAMVLLPVIELSIGVAVASMASTAMTPAEARAALAAAVG